MDPITLYLDPDAEFCPTLDPDPSCFTRLRYQLDYYRYFTKINFLYNSIQYISTIVWHSKKILNLDCTCLIVWNGDPDPQSCWIRVPHFGSGSTTLGYAICKAKCKVLLYCAWPGSYRHYIPPPPLPFSLLACCPTHSQICTVPVSLKFSYYRERANRFNIKNLIFSEFMVTCT